MENEEHEIAELLRQSLMKADYSPLEDKDIRAIRDALEGADSPQ